MPIHISRCRSNHQEEKQNKGNKNFDNGKTNSSNTLREQKAKIILSKEHAIRKVNDTISLAQSQTGTAWYKILMEREMNGSATVLISLKTGI